MKKILYTILTLALMSIPFAEAKDDGSFEKVGNDIILSYGGETITINKTEIFDSQKCPAGYHIGTAEDWSKAIKLWYDIKGKNHEYIKLEGNDLYGLSESCTNKDDDCTNLYTIASDFNIVEIGNSKVGIIRTNSKGPRNYPYLLVYHGLNGHWDNLDSTKKHFYTSIGLETCENVYVPNVRGMEGNQCKNSFKAYCFKDDEVINNGYSKEYNDAYVYAFNKKITTMPTIDEANMYGEIKRMEIAKMLSNWVRSFGFYKDTTASCNFTDTSSVKGDLATAIIDSCQYGIMGQGITKFRPYDNITRGEVATAISRILRRTKYNGGNPFYVNHVNALINEGILADNSDINTNELRGNVMTMLMKANDTLLLNIVDCSSPSYVITCGDNKKCLEKCKSN